jgi:tRNA threonylcarbamoyladenosine biosynthesis protein TsaE
MATIISHSPEETAALGRRFAETIEPGALLGLRGDLGAGKTEFVRGLARGLGYTGRVHSPTFALLNEYRGGRLPIYHIDLYRLETAREIESAGLDDFYYQIDGVTLIEWVDRLSAVNMPLPNLKLITFQTLNETSREITYDDPRA